MFVPKMYQMPETDVEQFIDENGFATLISLGDTTPIATHIPLELVHDETGNRILWGHVAKANPQWKDFARQPQVLVIFLSPIHHYISSSWYAQPNAPTWNYESVHVYGKLQIIEGEKLWQSIQQLTDKYEKTSTKPISLNTLPIAVQRQMEGLVGFEISIEKIEASSKLSQNRTEADRLNIIAELRKLQSPHAHLMAERMEQK